MIRYYLLAAALVVTSALFAQRNEIIRNSPGADLQSRTDAYFNNPAPGTLSTRFIFYLGKGNTLIIESTNMKQALLAPSLDSLIRAAWESLAPFHDSLSHPLASRRIDYIIGREESRIRIREYTQPDAIYRIRGNDTSQLKVEMDTLRIQLAMPAELNEGLRRFYAERNMSPAQITEPLIVLLVLNNLADLPALSTPDIAWAERRMREEADSLLHVKHYSAYQRRNVAFNVAQRSRVDMNPIQTKNRFHAPLPSLETGLQFVRGSFAPSIGLGLFYEWHKWPKEVRYLRLHWEPHFFFSSDADGRVRTDRNDFLTLKYSEREEKGTYPLTLGFYQTMSLGYQIRHRGNWFEPRTIKCGLPGVEAWRFRLEPEFFFNELFRNFSPSLKLTVVFE